MEEAGTGLRRFAGRKWLFSPLQTFGIGRGKKAGHYQIKCTLMCEEYEEPQVEWIDFEVVDN